MNFGRLECSIGGMWCQANEFGTYLKRSKVQTIPVSQFPISLQIPPQTLVPYQAIHRRRTTLSQFLVLLQIKFQQLFKPKLLEQLQVKLKTV
ncbi:hypothetical protein Droror1_Dr00018174 [Drosera rotundifolia]